MLASVLHAPPRPARARRCRHEHARIARRPCQCPRTSTRRGGPRRGPSAGCESRPPVPARPLSGRSPPAERACARQAAPSRDLRRGRGHGLLSSCSLCGADNDGIDLPRPSHSMKRLQSAAVSRRVHRRLPRGLAAAPAIAARTDRIVGPDGKVTFSDANPPTRQQKTRQLGKKLIAPLLAAWSEPSTCTRPASTPSLPRPSARADPGVGRRRPPSAAGLPEAVLDVVVHQFFVQTLSRPAPASGPRSPNVPGQRAQLARPQRRHPRQEQPHQLHALHRRTARHDPHRPGAPRPADAARGQRRADKASGATA